MTQKKRISAIITLVVICCAIMAVIDGVIKPDYHIKSIIKIILFLLCPLIYSYFDPNLQLKRLFRYDKKELRTAVLLGAAIYVIILGAYLLLKDVFDFNNVTISLTGDIGVTRDNFVIVALYISFINSLLEEFFFRGFAFLGLRQVVSTKFAYAFSSITFALYHVAMMTGWFSIGPYFLIMIGLIAGGIIFNYLNARNNTIYTSWLVHMFANFAINTVGFILFGIISI